MRTVIDAKQITGVVASICQDASYFIEGDVLDAWLEALRHERSPLSRQLIGMMIRNAATAWRERMPICQDTGQMVFLIDIGQDVHITGGSLQEAFDEGVERGGTEGYLRRSVMANPFDRDNAGTYGPAIVHQRMVPGNELRIVCLPNGCGCEQVCSQSMLFANTSAKDIVEFVVQAVRKAGSRPCPPVVIGVGLGGNLEQSALLARRALARPLDAPNSAFGQLEEEVLARVNQLDIGPQGLGGDTTALAVNVESYGTHRANFPVAVAINCHICRRKEFVFGKSEPGGEDEELRERLYRAAEDIPFPEAPRSISLPLTPSIISELQAGEWVLLSGPVYTARDAAHKRLIELIRQGEPLPFEMDGATIYYVGPSAARPGQVIGSAGPTTSYRMDAYTPELLGRGLKGIIGKGYRTAEVVSKMVEHGAVYFAAPGGAGALLGQCIVASEPVAFDELGTEAIRKLTLKDFPAVVAIDSHGTSLYRELLAP
jgi:fumarate hydratase class I